MSTDKKSGAKGPDAHHRLEAHEEMKRINGKAREQLNAHVDDAEEAVTPESLAAEQAGATPHRDKVKNWVVFTLALLCAGGIIAIMITGIHGKDRQQLNAELNEPAEAYIPEGVAEGYPYAEESYPYAQVGTKMKTRATGLAMVPVDTATVNIDGKPTPVIVYLFSYDSDGVPENASLNAMARTACKSGKNVTVVAYTDEHGSAAYNRQLSQRRAENIGRYMKAHGVDGKKIKVKGNGPTHQYGADNQNRRAVISLN